MSDAEREQLGAVLDRAHGELVQAICGIGARSDMERARAIVDAAPYAGDEAVEAGLVDETAYEDELPGRLVEDAKKPRVRAAGRLHRNADRAASAGAIQSVGCIAVIRVHGTIAGSVGFPGPIDGHRRASHRSGSDGTRQSTRPRRRPARRLTWRQRPRKRSHPPRARPAGGREAPRRLPWRTSQRAAATTSPRPLIALSRSPPQSPVPIGVIGARVVIDPLLARFGVVTEVLQRGAHARMLDPLLPLDDDARAAVDREIDHVYRAFLAVVASGRRRPIEEIEVLAQGRVWIGADAHTHGLVDRLGGFEDALEAVRERIGRGASRLRVRVLRPRLKSFPVLESPARKSARALLEAVAAIAPGLALDAAVLALHGERVLAFAMPLPDFG